MLIIELSKRLLFIVILSSALFSCSDELDEVEDDNQIGETTTEETYDLEIPDWTESTHGNNVEPDYDIVFDQNTVQRFDIKINPEDWQAMIHDMVKKYGPFGADENTGGPVPGGGSRDNPVFVPCSFSYEGIEWYKVGIRFKGNSSLRMAWNSGIWKLPFKLDFDEFEDTYPDIKNQRFYGFKQLSLSSGFNDKSLVREKISADLFREAGIPAAQTAFYQVYIDKGDDPIYFGLYTAVEVIDDTMIETQYGNDDGNIYKPEGQGATFANGTFSQLSFTKKNNEDEADWSDIISLFNVLHENTRTTDPATWRANLENSLNVPVFLRWLAVNTVIQNWDTYGKMSHNYYLYADVNNAGKITWIPWDNNGSMAEGRQGGALSVSLHEVGNDWPLIRYLMDDDNYLEIYQKNVGDISNNVYEPSTMKSTFMNAHQLVAPYVVGENGEKKGYSFIFNDQEFENEFIYLNQHVESRYLVVTDYLN